MDPAIATGTPAVTGPVHFLNIEYFFYLLYTLVSGGHAVAGGGFQFGWLIALLTLIWVTITVVAYVVSLGFLALLIYSTIRMHEIKDADSVRFQTILDTHHAEEVTEHHRWNHVRELIESPQESDWRQAIIEADIILDDMLNRLGYTGDTMAEKFRKVNPADFHTLHDAMEAHGVRNRIAHDGSNFMLTDHLAYRTILQYENTFREHGEI